MNRKILATIILILFQILAVTSAGCFESSTSAKLGDYAKDYLQGSKYTKLIIEIDYVEGFPPSNQALDTLRSRMYSYCDKPEGILIIPNSIPKSSSTYSDDDIRDLEDEHRNYHMKGSDIVAYVLYLNGVYSTNDDALGLAYGASSIAIFKEKIDNADIPFWATNQVDNTDYEKSVLIHEFGHLLAMVNIGYESERNHEDIHKHHCINEKCVMYYSIETVSIITLITQSNPLPPSDFDDDCRHDLNMLKIGGY